MQIYSYDRVYDFMGKRLLFLAVSLAVFTTAIVLLFTKGFNYGIDFSGGTVIQVRYQGPAPIDAIRDALKNSPEYGDAAIQEFGDPSEIIIKLPTATSSVSNDIGDTIREILQPTGNLEIRRVDMVGPKVGAELREKGLMALLIALSGVLVYIAFRFEWRFGVASVVALIHDITITAGAVSLFDVSVNLEILAALLTILGYSLNDTIVVFDRIREGLATSKHHELDNIINESVSRTLSRTTLTSLTTFFVVVILFFFGGELINGLALTLMVGIIVGTYSSIFVAASALKLLGFSARSWKEKEADRAKIKAEKERMRAQYEQGIV